LKEAGKKLSQLGFQYIVLGQFGNTPKNLSFKEIKNVIYPNDYFGMRDSYCQWLVTENLSLAPIGKSTPGTQSANKALNMAKSIELSSVAINKNPCSVMISSSTFFKEAHEKYIIDHRHESPEIRQAYDKRFGLILQ